MPLDDLVKHFDEERDLEHQALEKQGFWYCEKCNLKNIYSGCRLCTKCKWCADCKLYDWEKVDEAWLGGNWDEASLNIRYVMWTITDWFADMYDKIKDIVNLCVK